MVHTALRLQNPCSLSVSGWNPEYNVCMKAILPRAMAGHFILMEDTFDESRITFKKEDRTNKVTSYIATCQADSGSGHWVTLYDHKSSISQNEKDDNTRRALVAVVSKAAKTTIMLPNGKSINIVCGGRVKNPSVEGKSSGKFKAYAPYAIKTTHKQILKFIKKWSIEYKDCTAQRILGSWWYCDLS